MSLAEILNPDFVKELLESFETISNALQNMTRVGFDDSSRLRVRAEYLDDGYIRVRDTSASIDILEMLREFSWTFYNLAESNKLLNDLAGALSSVGTDELRTSVVDVLPESPFNITKVAGTALTGRDWSGDFAKLQNLDTTLSTRASESTLSTLSGKFPSAVALGDSLGNPTTTITGAANLGWDGTYWRRVAADTSGRMKVALDSIPNPSNLDVALSTRASDSTLSTLSGKFPSAVALGDSLSNPTTTIIGDALLGFDGTYWRRVRVDTSGRLAIQNEPNIDVALSTQSILDRWGYNVEPAWIFGSETTAPAAGTALVSKTVSTGKKGYIFGVYITAQEGNDFKINWTSGGTARSIRIIFPGKGTLMSTFPKAYNEGYYADAGTSITITNVNAGSTGIIYQAGILYLEV